MKQNGIQRELSLKWKIVFTLLILVGYRLLSHIPLPFVNRTYLADMLTGNPALGMWNLLTGGNLEAMSVVALGITPYITASIVLQMMGVVIPKISQLQKEGSSGQDKIKRITLVLSVILGLIQSIGMMIGYGRQGLLISFSVYTVAIPAVIMTLGVLVLAFAGQIITDKLFGNGTTLILVAGILCSYPTDAYSLFGSLLLTENMGRKILNVVLGVVIIVLLFGFTVWLMNCEKHIHIIFSGKTKASRPQESVIPLKLVGGNVVPVIFASTVLMIPTMIASFAGVDWEWLKIFDMSNWLNLSMPWASVGLLLYFVMIIGFSYYYQALNLNEAEMAMNLQKRGGTIAGIRPGKSTELYLKRQMKYMTLLGGVGLCIVAVVPICMMAVFHVGRLSLLGTSIIIVVSCMADLWNKWITGRQEMMYEKSSSFFGTKRLK